MTVKQYNAAPQRENSSTHEDDYEAEPVIGGSSFLVFNAAPSWLTSLTVHCVALLVLAWITVPPPPVDVERPITMTPAEEIIDWDKDYVEPPTPPDLDAPPVTAPVAVAAVNTPFEENTPEPEDWLTGEDGPMDEAVAVDFVDFSNFSARRGDWATIPGDDGDGPFGKRRIGPHTGPGPTPVTEAAIAAALKWLAAHQCQDGSWNFDHRRGGPSQADPGTLTQAPRGATGLALMAFLGTGQTHQHGKYQRTVRGGLLYLVRSMKRTSGGGASFEEPGGRMYSHGICSIALCEAYGMTKDRDLMQPAQAALNHIVYAQDPVGGGWRYTPRQPGDTSVVGWMLMALKSGHLSYLDVDTNSVVGATRFLDAVQSESGAKYGYTGPGGGNATTAIGLLSRMYTGWEQDHASLERGVEYLSKTGPSKNNMYYNYYATQVMFQADGPYGDTWNKWNREMRDYLTSTQSKHGAEAGSWFFGKGGEHGAERGGRLYHTAMAAMILEVYYRIQPIYQKQASEEPFEL